MNRRNFLRVVPASAGLVASTALGADLDAADLAEEPAEDANCWTSWGGPEVPADGKWYSISYWAMRSAEVDCRTGEVLESRQYIIGPDVSPLEEHNERDN